MNGSHSVAALLKAVPIQETAVVFLRPQDCRTGVIFRRSAIEVVFQPGRIPTRWAICFHRWKGIGDPFLELLAQLIDGAVRLRQKVGRLLHPQLLKELPAIHSSTATQ